MVLADHGNCEEMFVVAGGKRLMRTSHTRNLVPCFIYDPGHRGEYAQAALESPGLTNVAATLLNLLGFVPPEDYQPALIRFPQVT